MFAIYKSLQFIVMSSSVFHDDKSKKGFVEPINNGPKGKYLN